MSRPPRSPRESIFAGGLGTGIVFSGLIIGCSALVSFVVGYRVHGNLTVARTMCFGVLIIAEMFFALRCRSERVKIPVFENKLLIGAIAISVALMIGVMYIPYVQEIFSVTPPDKKVWLEILLFSLVETVVSMVLGINKCKVIKGQSEA
jgi:Ca2+-transporting ATPase